MKPNINKVQADFLVKGHLAAYLAIGAVFLFLVGLFVNYRVTDENTCGN